MVKDEKHNHINIYRQNIIPTHDLKRTLNKLGTEENIFNLINSICTKPTANIILDGKRLSPSIRNKIRMSTLTLSSLHSTRVVPVDVIRQNKNNNNKGIQIIKT